MSDGSRRAILAAFLANLGIASAKLAAWVATGAASMLAEGVHSLADTGNQGLLILGSARARRAPDAEHPFGYGTERYFWAFVVAVVLFLMGGLFAIWEGIEKLRHPHEISSPAWAVGVLLVGMVLEGLSLRTAVAESNELRGSASWWSFVHRSKNPEFPVVLLEDVGGLLGLALALAGVMLSVLLHDSRFDAFASAAIGALLCGISVLLSVEMKSLLIGESASPRDLLAIRHALVATPRVRRVIHLRTLHLGPDQLLVAAKLELDASLDFTGVAGVINRAEDAVRASVPSVRMLYLEPDTHDPEREEGAPAGAKPAGTRP